MLVLHAAPLTAEAFASFGDVLEMPDYHVDDRPNRRFDDLARVDAGADGRAMVSLLAVKAPVALPLDLPFLERHPLGSQAFIPCGGLGQLVIVVAPPGDAPDLSALRAFITDGRQGVNYLPGIWHASVSALAPANFVVVDRNGPGGNCDIVRLDATPVRIVAG